MSSEPEKPNKQRRWWIWIASGLLILIAIYFLFPRHAESQSKGANNSTGKKTGKGAGKAGPRAVPVAVAKAHRGDIPIYVTGLGNVTAYNTVTVRTRVDGELINVAFREGQMVKQGDPLAEIDPRPYQVQLTQAEGQMARDQATLENARIDLQRYLNLIQQNAVTRQQVDTQVATVKQSEGTVKSDQGAIDNARLQLTYCHIVSPLTGRIGLRAVDRGNIVHAADTTGLATITQLQPIAIIFNMPEDNLPEVQRQIRIKRSLVAEAYDRDLQTKLATGALLTLDNQIDQTTGTVRVKLQFANRDNTLFPNQFVNARLLVDTHRGVVLMPSAAIQRSPQDTFVYVVKGDQTVEMRKIKTSATEGDQIEVDQGVSPGDTVVIQGTDKLQQGMKVSVRQSGKNNISEEDEMGSDTGKVTQ